VAVIAAKKHGHAALGPAIVATRYDAEARIAGGPCRTVLSRAVAGVGSLEQSEPTPAPWRSACPGRALLGHEALPISAHRTRYDCSLGTVPSRCRRSAQILRCHTTPDSTLGRDRDGKDFTTQKKAQLWFKRHSGSRTYDPWNLDSDNDGNACESQP
jgi:hypothetical protein